MGAAGGAVLRFFGLAIRVLQFLASAVILGIFSYYLAMMSRHGLAIPTWTKAVEGLSGAAALYSLLGALFVCCLGGIAFFAFTAIVLDICFVGAMIAIAVMTRHGTQSCSGYVQTPLGDGDASSGADTRAGTSFKNSCNLEKAAFAVSIIGIFFFLISIIFQVLLARHHKREKRFGPSPANNYTSGTSRKWWSRKKTYPEASGGVDTLPAHPTPADIELGAEKQAPQKKRFGLFGKKKEPAPFADTAPNNARTGYGYGGSAYTGNM
ncbi:hypothetical protein N7539_003373 [Penicillium diatomitis]|uniref:MARVEL domain-containing protein n=1 Tax=Penicillium diatomitis TaxID=2819901 RepID=A0A9W9XCN3_9EURO|nr:uncharacterized protein N7539_003373 [Penicillium diatomitis]KAJ5488483.1 hypothetical protein N7539_003373 [Penicillium diatomitis]